MNVNDILVSTWGYDQTNVDFYKVVSKTEKFVKLQQIETIENYTPNGFMVFKAVPDESKTLEKPFSRKIASCLGRLNVKIGHGQWAEAWDGTPVCGSSYG